MISIIGIFSGEKEPKQEHISILLPKPTQYARISHKQSDLIM